MAMQKIRYSFGFGATVLFILLSLGWFLHQTLCEKILEEARYFGYNAFTYEKLSLSTQGIILKNIRLSHQKLPHFITAEKAKISFSWNSLNRRAMDSIDIEGLSFEDSVERVFLTMEKLKKENTQNSEKPIFLRAYIKGLGILKTESQENIPVSLDIHFDGQTFKKIWDINVHPQSDRLSGNFHFFVEKNAQDIKINTKATGFKLSSFGHKFSAQILDFIVSSSPYQREFEQNYQCSLVIKEGLLDALIEGSMPLPIEIDTKVNCTIGENLFHLQGDGQTVLLGQPIHMILKTENEKIALSLEGDNTDKTSSIQGALDRMTHDHVKSVTGGFSFKSMIEIPIYENDIDKYDLLSSLFTKITDLFISEKKQGTLNIHFDKFSMETNSYSIKNLQGSIQSLLFPYQIRGTQKISCETFVLPSSIPISNVEVIFSPRTFPMVDEVKAKAFDGNIHVHSVQRKNPTSYTFLFDLKGMEMHQALLLLDIPNLQGQGRVQGTGQMEYNEISGLKVMNIRMSDQNNSGNIQYKIASKEQEESKESEDAASENLAFKILEDLHYTHFVLEIAPQDGKIQAFLEIMGYNPKILSAHPFHFKIKTSGDLEETLHSSFRNFRLPKAWKDFKSELKQQEK